MVAFVLLRLFDLSFCFSFRYGYKAPEHFVNWFAWFVKHRSFGESFNTRNAIVYILFVVLFIPFPFLIS